MNTVQLDVVSSEDSLFSGKVAFVVIPTEMGEIGVYPKHEPLLGRVRPGVLRIKQNEESTEEVLLAVSGGVVEIQPDCITVLSEIALRSDELDEQQAQKAKEEAEKMLAQGIQSTPGTASAEARLAAAIAQLKAVEYIRQRERR